MDKFINFYLCDRCKFTWQDEWDCMCDDRCPECNRSISPLYSIDYSPRQINVSEAFNLKTEGVELEILHCSMFTEDNGNSRLTQIGEDPHFFDVIVRPANVPNTDPIIEIENLDAAAATMWANKLQILFAISCEYAGD